MKNTNLPPSPFGAGTTYTGHEKRIISPDFRAGVLPRIARRTGESALHDTIAPPRIARPEERPSPEEERRHYLETIFRFPDPAAKDRYGRPLSKRTEVTPESEVDAAYVLRFTDRDIREIIDSFKDQEYWREEDMPRLLRENNELRVTLGIHLIDKFATILSLPERVHQNSPSNLKSPGHAGYPDKMLSRDYAALLALSMLDGTYVARPATGETTHHRTAAEMVLGIHGQMESDRIFYRLHGVDVYKK